MKNEPIWKTSDDTSVTKNIIIPLLVLCVIGLGLGISVLGILSYLLI